MGDTFRSLVMKHRRHHNNKGLRQIKNGKTYEYIKKLSKKLGIDNEKQR